MEQKTEASQAVTIEFALRQIVEADDNHALTQQLIDIGRAALKAQPAPTEVQGDALAGYTKWMHDSSKYPHSDDMRHPFEAFKAGAKWAQLSGNPGELAQGEDSARLDALYYAMCIKPFIAAICTKEQWLKSIDNQIDRARASAETGGVKP